MRSFSFFRFCLLATAITAITSCSSKKEVLDADTAPEFLPLEVGKYITYRVDSLVFTQFQRVTEIHRYQVKHVVDAEFTDNSGHKSFRIYRYRRNADGSGDWDVDGTYQATTFNDRVEVSEDNLRFIKLKSVLKEGDSWKGNSYLPSNPYEPFGFKFSIDNDMANWDYTYDLFEPVSMYEDQTYNDVYTVTSQDKAENYPSNTDTVYAARTLSVEKYSKNIGLVYRNQIMVEHQPNPTGVITDPPYSSANPKIIYDPFDIGFGITMWMIDHN